MSRFYQDSLKALKRAAREEFGFQPTRISSNRKKYARSRENRAWRQDVKSSTRLAYGEYL